MTQPTPQHVHKLGNPDDDGLMDDWDNCRDPECPGPQTPKVVPLDAARGVARGAVFGAVYAHIRSLPDDAMPTNPVERNAMIWRAVHAGLAAINRRMAEEARS